MLCSDNGRTRLLTENTDDLSRWPEKDDKMDPELAYWIPKYILMRGDKPFSELRAMSGKMLSLARSQDKIGWHNFTEGYISTHFYDIQQFYLAMHGNHLTETNWTKHFISRPFDITHSQWVYRNISLHDKSFGYIHNKQLSDITRQIDELADATSESIPPKSRFLLDISFPTSYTDLKTKTYWVIAMEAALAAKGNNGALGSRGKKSLQRAMSKTPSRKKLGITEVERQIRADSRHIPDQHQGTQDKAQTTMARFLKHKQNHPLALMAQLKSNKHQHKPD